MTPTADTDEISGIVEELRARLGAEPEPEPRGGVQDKARAGAAAVHAGLTRTTQQVKGAVSGPTGHDAPGGQHRAAPAAVAKLTAAGRRRQVQVPAAAALAAAVGVGAVILRRR